MRRNLITMLIASSLLMGGAPLLADPPAHAPAHGWRKKHDAHYIGYSGRQWERDFEISSGRCNRQEIATVVGGIAGGVIANRVADEHRTVATIVGAIAGAVIGNRIGRELDEADRRCLGHALEIAEPGQRVRWNNEATGMSYEMSLGGDSARSGAVCREYTLVTSTGRRDRSSHAGLACQSGSGAWQIRE